MVHHAKPAPKKTVAKPLKPPKASASKPLVAAGAPVAATAATGGLSPGLLIIAFGLLLALLGVGLSFMPASAVPFAVGLRLERSRQSIMLVGIAIGIACVLVGLLTAAVGR